MLSPGLTLVAYERVFAKSSARNSKARGPAVEKLYAFGVNNVAQIGVKPWQRPERFRGVYLGYSSLVCEQRFVSVALQNSHSAENRMSAS